MISLGSLLVSSGIKQNFVRYFTPTLSLNNYVYHVKKHNRRWSTIRDIKRRHCYIDHEIERSALRHMQRLYIELPEEVVKKAQEDMQKLDKNSNYVRQRSRCILNSRSRGLVTRYRLGRMFFREYVRSGQIAGVMTAKF